MYVFRLYYHSSKIHYYFPKDKSKIFCTLVKIVYICSPIWEIRGVAQLASASGLGPEGPVFESQYPDKGRGDDDESPPFLIAETLRAHSPVERLAKPA